MNTQPKETWYCAMCLGDISHDAIAVYSPAEGYTTVGVLDNSWCEACGENDGAPTFGEIMPYRYYEVILDDKVLWVCARSADDIKARLPGVTTVAWLGDDGEPDEDSLDFDLTENETEEN